MTDLLSQSKYLIRDGWLMTFFHRDVYRFVADETLLEKGMAEPLIGRLNELMSKPVFIYAKVPVKQLGVARFLSERGFALVDTQVTFEKAPGTGLPLRGHSAVRFALPQDEENVARLAGRSFIFSRFHQDSQIDRALADEIKAEWARSFFRGARGDQMIVAQQGENIVGFLQILKPDRGQLIIDLIAVDQGQQGRGIAGDMIAYAENQNAGCRTLRVGTQIANRASILLYEKSGFRYQKAAYVFHFHRF